MSRYLITHDGCRCGGQTPGQEKIPGDVGLFLWGRDVTQHTVFDRECPYYFNTGNMDALVVTLILYPFLTVRHLLPLDITVKTLWQRVMLGNCPGGEALVCRIGGER